MNISCGTDIIEIERIKKLIDETARDGLDRIYTKSEVDYCESKKNVKYQHYAVRFAAKEAIFKAISDKLDNKFDISWNDVEVLNDKNGRPKVNFISDKIKGIKNIEISLSHCKEYAVANVVALWEEN
ncbi:MAG: holo-ACP synthase [Clostridia bacterium]|jgi:holo-[acyl-carrier protein] synthase|nr:holo-ACP synthase [Clostridia bacterium]